MDVHPKPIWERPRQGTVTAPALASPVARELLRARFKRVILGAGYSERVAESILAQWFELYLKDIPKFIKMLEEYENGNGE